MKFNKQIIKDYNNTDYNIYIKRCQHYSIYNNDLHVGDFYFGLQESLGLIGDICLTIRSQDCSWVESIFELHNCNNNALIGHLAISNFVFYKSLKISLDLIHRSPYQWLVIESFREESLFTGTTSVFSALLFNDQEQVTIKWNYKSTEFGKYRFEELPVNGEIEFTSSINYYLLFAALFLSELELQMKSVE